ncbi:MAG: hypothetical protein AABW80_00340 [Nanoarchaeota archaeon]
MRKTYFISGILILILLIISFFVRFDVQVSENKIINDSLLGILIFHSPIILTFYIILAIYLIIRALWKIKLIE